MHRGFSLFGCSLDPDEREQVISYKKKQAKLGYPGVKFREPYDALLYKLRNYFTNNYGTLQFLGKMRVDPWLLPAPEPKYVELLNVENVVNFIDLNGCLEYALSIYDFLKEHVSSIGKPLLVGVDHSLSGGVLRFLGDVYDPDDLGVVVLDGHCDAITSFITWCLISYDMEKNPKSPFNSNDPFIVGRPESYNAQSFLLYLMEKGWIKPENVVVMGITDYPRPWMFESEDFRIRKYVEHYLNLESKGLKLIKKNELEKDISIVQEVLARLDVKKLYISIDVDVGANVALKGARFTDHHGLSSEALHQLVSHILNHVKKRAIEVVGLDMMETDVFKAALDSTYDVEASLIVKIVKAASCL